MKILNKGELQRIAINHSSDINSKDFITVYKKCTAEAYTFLVNDTTLASDNPLRLEKIFLTYNKIMTIKIADKITSVSKKSTKALPNDETKVDVEEATLKNRYISPEERQQIINELRLA